VEGTRGGPAWRLDELGSIGRENLDPGHVARYDDKEDAHAAAELRVVQAAGGLDERSTVVELGAGTGQFALAAAAVFARVIAVDPSPVMLQRLRQNAEAWSSSSSSSSSLEIVEGGFLTYQHAGPPADLVYSRYALHHLPDFWKALALERIRAMLRPGGLLRLWDIVYHFGADEAEARIEDWCSSRPVHAPEGEWNRADLEEHVRDEHSTFTWLLEPMLHHAGFEIRDAWYAPDGFDAKYLLLAT
jgi:SAM-dependent methyltransferase